MTGEFTEIDARRARRVGLVSDSHGPIDPRIVEALGGCDVVIHAGDVGGADVLSAVRAPLVVAVRGNNDTPDHWGGSTPEMPGRLRVRVAGGEFVVVHGHEFRSARQRHAQLRKKFSDARIVIYGHSHRRCIDRATTPWVINPGACGRARTFGGPSAVILERQSDRWQVRELVYPPVKRKPGRRPKPAGSA